MIWALENPAHRPARLEGGLQRKKLKGEKYELERESANLLLRA
jgi:hypothetical protein